MNRSELCARVPAAASMSKADAAAGAVFSAIADALARGETVTFAGFGKFTTRDPPARAGRNPQNGQAGARECRPSRPRRPFATRSTHSKGSGPIESPVLATPMSSHARYRAPERENRFAMHARRYAGSEVSVLPRRFHAVDRRTSPHWHSRLATPLTLWVFGPRPAHRRPRSGRFRVEKITWRRWHCWSIQRSFTHIACTLDPLGNGGRHCPTLKSH